MSTITRIEDNFSLILALGFIFGMAVPRFFSLFNPYILIFLMAVMFFSILKIDVGELLGTIANPLYVIYLSCIVLFVVPVACYGIASIIMPEISAATLIACALPTAVSSTSITILLKGNANIALVVTVLTALVVPFTLPALVELLIGVETSASYLDMVVMLAEVVILPFFLALAAKRAMPRAIGRTKRYYPTLNVFFLFFVIAGPVAKNASLIYDNLGDTVEILAFFFFIMVLRHLLGWYASSWRPFEDRIASTTVIAYSNIGLGIGFAYDFFSPFIVLVVVLYEVIWNIMPVPFQYAVKKLSLKENI